MNFIAYSRTKKITLVFDGVTRVFTLLAPSARDKENALLEAQDIHAKTIRRLAGAADSLQAVFLLQDQGLLAEALLAAEEEQIRHKASLTLVKDGPDYQERLAAKTGTFLESRRSELAALPKEKLAERLTTLEIERQLQTAWTCAVLEAVLARALGDDNGRQLFPSAEAMKEALPGDVLAKLGEALAAFIAERGNAQVFPEPHTSNG